MAYSKIRPRRDTAKGWEYHNPILAEGEMGFEVPETGVGTGVSKVKIGDGVTAWQELPYAIDPASGSADIKYNTEDDPPVFGDKDFLWISTK